MMSYTDAIATRVRQLNGKPVDPKQLEEALEVIKTTRRPVPHSKFAHANKGNKPRKAAPADRIGAEEPELEVPVATEREPWGLITPGERLADPEHYPWPRAE